MIARAGRGSARRGRRALELPQSPGAEEQDRQREALNEMMVGRMETLVPMGKGLGVAEGHGGPKTDKVPGGEVEEKLNEFRDSMVVVTEILGETADTRRHGVSSVHDG